MGVNYMLVLVLCWTLIVVSCVGADSEGKVTPNASVDPKGSSNNGGNLNQKTGGLNSVDSNKVDHVKEGKGKLDGSEKGVQDSKLKEGNSGEQKQTGSKKDNIQGKDKEGSVGKNDKREKDTVQGKDKEALVGKSDKKEKLDKGAELKGAAQVAQGSSPPVRKEGSHVEECDAPNSCKDEKNTLVACLRVSGNESPDGLDLSLLVQNKGNDPLSVTISAPDFVHLEKTIIQLKEKEDKKVKVSIKKAGTESLMVLTTRNGKCALDFKDLIALNFRKETASTTESTYFINFVKQTPVGALVFLGALVVAASAWMCISFQKRNFTSNNSKYEKLDMELPLPISGGAKTETNSNDGWENSWGDDWDDEEAPKMPSMPVTPSLSSKGLAPRRLNKESWKD